MTPVVPPPPVLQIFSSSSSDHSSQRSHATNISETSDPDAWFIRQRTPSSSPSPSQPRGADTPAPAPLRRRGGAQPCGRYGGSYSSLDGARRRRCYRALGIPIPPWESSSGSRGNGDWRPSPTLTWPRSCISSPAAVWRIIALCLWCRPRAALAATSPHMRKLLNDIHPEYTLLRTETFLGLRRRRVWRHRPISPGHSGSSNLSEWYCSSEATITDPDTSDLEGAWTIRRGVPPPPDEDHWLDYMDTPPPPDTPLARWPVGARVDRLVNRVFDIWAPATVTATSPSGTHSIRFVRGGDDEDGVEGWDLRARRDSPSHSPERRDISPRTTS